jgi:dihydroorotate dehydrogenase (NAD+) catalytic subunit
MVWQASRAVSLPICGIGGITSADDAIKFLLCGATAVQIGTSNYLDPAVAGAVVDGIEAYLAGNGIPRASDLVGALEISHR